jgi:hypothetical protein
MEFNRFDMEQQLMSCWGVVDDMKVVIEEVLEGDYDRDKVANMLLGMEALYDAKFNKLFAMFENGVTSRSIL